MSRSNPRVLSTLERAGGFASAQEIYRLMQREGESIGQLSVCYDTDRERAIGTAHEIWPNKWKASTGGPEIEVMRGVWAELQNHALELAGQEERVDHRSLEVQREEALSLGDVLKAEELDREPELKLGPAANAIERRAQLDDFLPQHCIDPGQRLVIGQIDRLFGIIRVQRLAQIILDRLHPFAEFSQPQPQLFFNPGKIAHHPLQCLSRYHLVITYLTPFLTFIP